MAKLLFLSGSTRVGSINAMLAKAGHDLAVASGYEATLLTLKDYPMPLYDGDLEDAEGLPDNAAKLSGVFEGHDGIFLACPEYNAGITPLLKNSIDWMSRISGPDGPPAFAGKVFALGAASPGGFGGVRASIMVRHILTTGLGQIVLGKQALVPGAGSAFSEDGTLAEGRAKDMLEATVHQLHKVAEALKAQ